jgi:hypothetical protein
MWKRRRGRPWRQAHLARGAVASDQRTSPSMVPPPNRPPDFQAAPRTQVASHFVVRRLSSPRSGNLRRHFHHFQFHKNSVALSAETLCPDWSRRRRHRRATCACHYSRRNAKSWQAYISRTRSVAAGWTAPGSLWKLVCRLRCSRDQTMGPRNERALSHRAVAFAPAAGASHYHNLSA